MENHQKDIREKLKHAIRFDFREIKRLVPEVFESLKQTYEADKRLTTVHCCQLRWLVKAACYLYEEVALKIQIRNFVDTVLAAPDLSIDDQQSF